MPTENSYLDRAAACRRQAAMLIDNPAARKAWLQLAEQWVAFSQIPFHRPPPAKPEIGMADKGLWRGS